VRQQSLATQTGFEKYGRKSKREPFLDEMEQIVPWAELEALVEPHYPKGENGRPPVGLGIMLRMYFLQQWFNLSDPGAEDALYESPVLRRFVGIDLGRAPAPDESTILQFRHLLERHELVGLFKDVEYRDPVHASRLHRDRPNPALFQPIGHRLQLDCGAPEPTDRFAVPCRRNSYVVRLVANVNAGGIGMNHF